MLEANPELLSQASEVRTNMKYYEQEFVSNYSKKLAVAKNSIVANSDRSEVVRMQRKMQHKIK